MTRRVAVVVTNRASYARIRSALAAMRERDDLDVQVVAGGSLLLDKYGAAVRVVEEDGFSIGARVYMVLEGQTPTSMAKTTAVGMMELATVFDHLRPDAVLTVADRYETIATAVTASYMNIPVAHVQGGEVTGSIDEKVRHAVTKLSDIHFVSTERSGERLMRMGERPEAVHVTGCPSVDLAADVVRARPRLDFDPFERYKGVGPTLDLADRYLVVMQHPVTTEYGHARAQVEETLEAVARLGLPTLWFWPNVDAGSDDVSKGIRVFREARQPANLHFFKNMHPEDFLTLLNASACIVGNSSVAIRECSFLGVPAVNVGSRQQGRERGANVVDVPHAVSAIAAAVSKQLEHGRYASERIYGDGRAGERIARLIAEEPLDVEKRWPEGRP